MIPGLAGPRSPIGADSSAIRTYLSAAPPTNPERPSARHPIPRRVTACRAAAPFLNFETDRLSKRGHGIRGGNQAYKVARHADGCPVHADRIRRADTRKHVVCHACHLLKNPSFAFWVS